MADNKGRRDDPLVFFIYDHNMLKKEEDDLKDAILYFSPEDMPADDQCALCGQLMGMSEFLTATLSKSTPMLFRFEHRKVAIKRIGAYSLGIQGASFTPDSLLKKQLKRMYASFVTYHGSIDSLRLRFRESHNAFLQELGNIWRSLLAVAGITRHMSLSKIFGAIPYVHLPKSGAHLFLQASHLLQACQRRPYVMAGAILYKNGVLCTQLPPALSRHLTLLQNQMPHISRTLEFDLPVGCKIVTLFLTDKQLQDISPLDHQAKRHCKVTDFRTKRNRESPCSDAETCTKSKNVARRLTCPNIGSVNDRKSGTSLTDKALNNFIKNEQRKSYQHKQESMAVDQLPWKKTRQKVVLSHVPIVECRSGESPLESPQELVHEVLGHAAKTSHFGQSYTELDVSERSIEDGEASETDNSESEQKSHRLDNVQDKPVSNNPIEKVLIHTDIDTESNSDSKISAINTNKEGSSVTIPLTSGVKLDMETVSDPDTFEQQGQQIDNDTDDDIEPSISDLEDESNKSSHKNTSKVSLEYERSGSFETYESDNLEIKQDKDVKSLDRDLNEMYLTESSIEIEDKRNYSKSDDRTVTVSKTAYHAVLEHKADVHTEDSLMDKSEQFGKTLETLDQWKKVENSEGLLNQCKEVESTNGTLDQCKKAERANETHLHIQPLSTESVRSDTDDNSAIQSENSEVVNKEQDKGKCDTKDRNSETVGNITDESNHSDSNGTSNKIKCNDNENSANEIDMSGNSKSKAESENNEKTEDKINKIDRCNTKALVNFKANDNTESNSSTDDYSKQDKKPYITYDEVKENIDPNIFFEESIDTVEESEIETEDESVRERNESPCINCLELISEKGNNSNNVENIYCTQCLAKLSQSLIFGKKQDHQEVIDFREKHPSPDSGTETEDIDNDKAEPVEDQKAGLIASSFSSDVSTDSTMSRYWTQEMDGLTDVTLYVQCHSDISMFLVLENPDKYQENLFHALWKGSLAQLADLDYYIKECLDFEDTDDKQDSYKYARFDNYQNRLEGNMLEIPEGTLESSHQHQMLSTMHSEFNQHQCLSDVVLRSQFFSCYGHQNQMDETYFQPGGSGPQKPSSGLPIPRDPVFTLDQTAKLRLSKDRKLSMI